jgi:octaprenyl-diphosphate synthase
MVTLAGPITLQAIEPYLAQVNDLFARELASDLDHVQKLAHHVERFRGKMLRPVLVFLSGLAARNNSQPLGSTHVTIATVVEMVHVATLVHDDVLDNAEIRRRGATINHLHGNEMAVLLGDLLISHAYHLCSSLDSQIASRAIGRTTNIVCEGELTQNFNRGNWALTENTYFDIIYRKTASLIETSCRLGAWASDADAATVAALGNYGRDVGMAFQIVDDLLDIVGQQKTVGKSLGTDIEKGKLTLPMIHFLATAAPTHQQLLISLLESDAPDRIDNARQLLIPSPSMRYARNRAQQLVDQAIAAIHDLPESEIRQILIDMARFVTARES